MQDNLHAQIDMVIRVALIDLHVRYVMVVHEYPHLAQHQKEHDNDANKRN